MRKGKILTDSLKNLPGTFIARKKDGSIYYRSSFTYKNKHISLGSYENCKMAHEAYLEAGRIVSDNDITIINYSSGSALPFEKWVVLCNFRDNNIYFATPIYMRKHYFSYYLDPQTELKFSIDDLFYYASHKIMRRNGHYFVADYGMQITILGRYGIKSYGVLGTDYNLINGDIYDFRYENIEILNSYHGVRLVTHRGKSMYQARIHINGYYIIGYYKTALEASIAYNKAIDILSAKGCQKQFKQNYMEGISASMYADIYHDLKISAKIMQYNTSL